MAAAAQRSDLSTRAVTGLILITLALIALWLGGTAFWLLASAAALVMLAEWCALAGTTQGRLRFVTAAMIVPLAVASPMLWGPVRDAVAVLVVVALVAAIGLGHGRLGSGVMVAGLPAIGLMFLRGLPHGLGLTLWTLAIVWATDIGAYFAGRTIGGPKLAPAISPNKTWAGLAGGIVAAGVAGLLIARGANLPLVLRWLGAPLAIVAQLGDLYESAFKRRAGVKDSGRLLPGHGGVLDRLDGVVPVATLVAGLFAAGLL